jgi:hypothetical protein
MGKRGPQPKGAGKSEVFSTRIRPELKAKLASAAKTSRRSLSQEIAHRLSRTFADDERIDLVFGDRQTFAVMRVIAGVVHSIRRPDNRAASWMDDPWLWEQATKAIGQTLKAIRPRGASSPPEDPLLHAYAELAADLVPAALFSEIQAADAALPLRGQEAHRQAQADRLKADLGDVADRPTVLHGTIEDQRRVVAAKVAEVRQQHSQISESEARSTRRKRKNRP